MADAAVAQHDEAVADRGGVGIMGDHHDGLVELVHGVAQQLQHLRAGLRVEVAGGLVGEHDGRPRDERARDRDTLLLSAGHLGRAVLAPVGEADRLDELVHPRLIDVAAGDRQRQRDVLLGVQDGQQVERLEDEADLLAPQVGEALVVERRDLGAVDLDRAGRRAVEARRGSASGSICRIPTDP